MFESFEMFSLIRRTVGPFFDAKALLNVLIPFTSIVGSIDLGIDTPTMRFIVFPLSLVHISIGVNESSSAVCPVVDPISFIESIVFPDLLALTITSAVIELSDVSGSILHCDWPFRYKG